MQSKSIKRRLLIADTLNQLLSTKELDNITVLELCGLSGVPRASFYRYFYNIREIAVWLFEYLLEKSITPQSIQSGWAVAQEAFYAELLRWKTLFLSFFGLQGYDSVFAYAARRSVENFTSSSTIRLGREITDKEKTIISYHGYVQASLTAKWVQDGMTIPPHEMAQIMVQFLPPIMKEYTGS